MPNPLFNLFFIFFLLYHFALFCQEKDNEIEHYVPFNKSQLTHINQRSYD